MDHNMVNIENLTNNAKIQFQDENYVTVIGKQYGNDYYDDCRPLVKGMREYVSPEATGVAAKMKKALSEDDLIALRRQLPYLFVSFSEGIPIVLPRFNAFTWGQEEEFVKAVRISVAKNAELIKKYNITLPEPKRENNFTK